MAQRGDGTLALTIACFASVIGGVIGIAAFVWVAPPLAVFALKFGPAEFFWLAMFGLTVIATLCEGNLIKGLMSGFLGLLLSTGDDRRIPGGLQVQAGPVRRLRPCWESTC